MRLASLGADESMLGMITDNRDLLMENVDQRDTRSTSFRFTEKGEDADDIELSVRKGGNANMNMNMNMNMPKRSSLLKGGAGAGAGAGAKGPKRNSMQNNKRLSATTSKQRTFQSSMSDITEDQTLDRNSVQMGGLHRIYQTDDDSRNSDIGESINPMANAQGKQFDAKKRSSQAAAAERGSNNIGNLASFYEERPSTMTHVVNPYYGDYWYDEDGKYFDKNGKPMFSSSSNLKDGGEGPGGGGAGHDGGGW